MKKIVFGLLLLISSLAMAQQTRSDSTYRQFSIVGDSVQFNEVSAFTFSKQTLITMLQSDSVQAQKLKVAMQNKIAIQNKLIIRLGKEIKYLKNN